MSEHKQTWECLDGSKDEIVEKNNLKDTSR